MNKNNEKAIELLEEIKAEKLKERKVLVETDTYKDFSHAIKIAEIDNDVSEIMRVILILNK
jgi:hypothetical protein